MSKSISAVVRCLNEVAHIERLVAGMRAQSVKIDELIFVDSGSTDGTLELIHRFGDKVVHIDRSEFSFGRSLNRGIEAATGDLVLICSAHVYPSHDDWVEKLADAFNDEKVVYAYGRQLGDHRTKFSEERVMKSWFPPTSIPNQTHPFANNANAMLRRDVWLDHQFDETLTGLEDVAWASYVQSRGYAVAYCANAPVYHVHEESWSTVRNRYRREAIAYRRIFPESSMSALRAIRLFLSSVTMDALAVLRNRRMASPGEILRFRANQFYGAWKGFADDMPDAELLARFYYPRRTGVQADPLDGQRLDYSSLLQLQVDG